MNDSESNISAGRDLNSCNLCCNHYSYIGTPRVLSTSDSPSGPISARQLNETTWKQVVGKDLILGPHALRVKVVEFYDYECPFCRSIQPILNEIRRKYPNDVEIIRRHFPLPNHSTAYPSAIAVECTNEQGQFEAYHVALFEHQGLVASLNWTGLAQMVGVPDLSRF